MTEYSNEDYRKEYIKTIDAILERVNIALYNYFKTDEEFKEALNGITDKFWQLRELYKQKENENEDN